jgi:hypothetical protein
LIAKKSEILNCAKNPFLEAVHMQGCLALLAHVHCFIVPVVIQGALLAVATPGLAASIQLVAHNPVVEPIKSMCKGEENYFHKSGIFRDFPFYIFLPLIERRQAGLPLEDRGLAVGHEHLDDEVAEEVHEVVLVASELDPKPPSIHSTHAEAPRVKGKPPLLYPIHDPGNSKKVV